MISKKLFVVHCPSLGWDSVSRTLYKAYDEETVRRYIMNNYGLSKEECEDEYVITQLHHTKEIDNISLLSDELADKIEKFIVEDYGVNPIHAWGDVSEDVIYPFLKKYLDENNI